MGRKSETTTRRLGVLLNRERCAYSFALAAALETVASRYSIELVYLPVGWATSKEELPANELSAILQRAEGLEGLLMISSVFSHGLQSLAKLAQLWWPRPASSVGYRLPLVPTVLVDNRGAMHAATEHLIVKHERRKILFVRGRVDSQEATDRYFGFRQALREHQIINDVGRVLQGDFTRESVLLALSVLPKDVEYDALIASNDEMALAALSELERRGARIPEEIAVIGFDDIPAAGKARVPLTTMAQPFDALASTAIKLVIEQCEGREVPVVTDVPVNFVRRVSCGCGSRRPERRESMFRPRD